MSKSAEKAVLYRMVMDDHICPFGLKSRHLLKSEGYEVEDNWLTTREQTDAFKREHQVDTTPQTFLGGRRVGGYDDLKRHFGKGKNEGETSYTPVVAVFAMAAAMALAATWAAFGTVVTIRSVEWFIAISMCILAVLKLRDISSFSTTFLGYDLVAQRYVPYAYF